MKIIIVGAGPAGLYLGIKLAKLNIPCTIIDPKENKYTRPGFLFTDLFEMVAKNIGHSFPFSHARHIKDLERGLYEVAVSLNIPIISASFVGFKEKAIFMQVNGVAEVHPCDIAIDATGSSRALIHAVNQKKPNTFHIHPLNNVKEMRHLIAFVKLSPDNSAAFKDPLKRTSIDYVEEIQKLRHEFGWNEFTAPSFHAFLCDKDKAGFYLELPFDLSADKHEAWLKAVLHFKTGRNIEFQQLSPSRKYQKPTRFCAFTVHLKNVIETSYAGDDELPMVIPIGDAQIETDYRKGTSIVSAMNRIECLVSAWDARKEANYAINLQDYHQAIKLCLLDHRNEMDVFYSDLAAKKKEEEKAAIQHYYLACDYDPTNKQWQEAKEEISRWRARQDLRVALSKLQIFFAGNKNGGVNEENLSEATALLTQALRYLSSSAEERINIQATLNIIASYHINLAYQLFSNGFYFLAEKSNLAALHAFKYMLPETVIDMFNLEINQISLAEARGNYSKAWRLIEKVEIQFPIVKEDQKYFLEGKIHYLKAKALLYLLWHDHPCLADKENKLITCEKLIKKLKDEKQLSHSIIIHLEQALTCLQNKVAQNTKDDLTIKHRRFINH